MAVASVRYPVVVTNSASFISGSNIAPGESFTFQGGLSGSLQRTPENIAYLTEGTNVTITTASNGQITINAAGGGGGSGDTAASYLVLANTSSLSNERAFTAGVGLGFADAGANSTLTLSTSIVAGPNVTVGTLGNSLVVSASSFWYSNASAVIETSGSFEASGSGLVMQGLTVSESLTATRTWITASSGTVLSVSGASAFAGAGTFSGGLSGSLQQTPAGISYLVAGSNVTIVTASNGQITIASTGGGGGPLAMGGDVTGTTAVSTVAKLQNRTLAATAPTSGQAIAWNNGTSEWEPTTITLGGSAGGDLNGSYPNPTVVDLTISGEARGDLLYRSSTAWLRLPAGNPGEILQTQGAGFDPGWTTATTQYTLPFTLVGPAGSGPGGTNPTYATIADAIAAIPSSIPALIVVMPGTYNENVSITSKEISIVGWGHYNGQSAGDAAVRITGTLTINPSSTGFVLRYNGLRFEPASGNAINITGSNSVDVDLSGTDARGFAKGVFVDNTSAATRVYADRLLCYGGAGNHGYHSTGAAHAHTINGSYIFNGSSAYAIVAQGGSVVTCATTSVSGVLYSEGSGSTIVLRFCYHASGSATPYLVEAGSGISVEKTRLDSNATQMVQLSTGAGTFVYEDLSVLGSVPYTFDAGVTVVPLAHVEGKVIQAIVASGNILPYVDYVYVGAAVTVTLPIGTNRLVRPITIKALHADGCTVNVLSSGNIDGTTSKTLLQWAALTVVPYTLSANTWAIMGYYNGAL